MIATSYIYDTHDCRVWHLSLLLYNAGLFCRTQGSFGVYYRALLSYTTGLFWLRIRLVERRWYKSGSKQCSFDKRDWYMGLWAHDTGLVWCMLQGSFVVKHRALLAEDAGLFCRIIQGSLVVWCRTEPLSTQVSLDSECRALLVYAAGLFCCINQGSSMIWCCALVADDAGLVCRTAQGSFGVRYRALLLYHIWMSKEIFGLITQCTQSIFGVITQHTFGSWLRALFAYDTGIFGCIIHGSSVVWSRADHISLSMQGSFGSRQRVLLVCDAGFFWSVMQGPFGSSHKLFLAYNVWLFWRTLPGSFVVQCRALWWCDAGLSRFCTSL
jgi:hypothetical protein